MPIKKQKLPTKVQAEALKYGINLGPSVVDDEGNVVVTIYCQQNKKGEEETFNPKNKKSKKIVQRYINSVESVRYKVVRVEYRRENNIRVDITKQYIEPSEKQKGSYIFISS